MLQKYFTGLLIGIMNLFLVSCASNRIHEVEEWDSIFTKYGVDSGAFILRDHTHDIIRYNNLEQVSERKTPASTFKIFSALVALEEAAIQDDQSLIAWDSVTRENENWNKNLSLRDAFNWSAVPHFQRLARKIGPQQMQHFLDTVRYGNKVMGGSITEFWLNDSLQISADEQLGFLKRLYFNELPFSDRNQRIVRSMMLQEDYPRGKLYYKTGFNNLNGIYTYWVVGFTEKYVHMKEHENSMNKSDVRIYPFMFAMNFSTRESSKEFLKNRVELTKELLRAADAWK